MREIFDVAVKKAPQSKHGSPRFLPRTLVLACVALFGVTSGARADEDDSFQVQTSVNMTHDDNLFLLPNPSVVPSGAPGTGSTWISTNTADFSFDHTYSQQVVHADLSLNRYIYDSLHYLNYDAVNYNASWQWQVTNKFTGTAVVDHEKFLDSYDDFHEYSIPNLSTHTGQTLKFDWNAIGFWHVVGGLVHANVTSPSADTAVGTFHQTDVQLGGAYLSAQGNSITIQARDSIGIFDREADSADLLDNEYKQREVEMLTHTQLGAWTTLDTRLGYVERLNDHYAQRNYRGLVGRAELDWQTSAYTTMKLTVARNVVSYESNQSSYYWLNEISLGPTWNVTSKLQLSGTGNVSWRTFDGAITDVSTLGAKTDRIYGGRLALTYKPTQQTAISLFANLSQQNASLAETAYRDKSFGISASWRF